MRNILIAVLCTSLLPACSDPEIVKPRPRTTASFQNLSERWHVLSNLEASYNRRDGNEYDRLIDDDFVFYFAPSDVGSGGIPQQWSRDTDVPATRRLLADALLIDLDIQFDQLQWAAIAPPAFPDETWYTTTVNYTFTMHFGRDPETTFITAGQPQVQFTVREVLVNGEARWRLVDWRDLAGVFFKRELGASEPSWGRIKALYQE